MDHARCMRFHAIFPLQFVEDAMDTIVYLINKGASSSLDDGILEEALTSKEVNYSFLRTFGCEASVHIDKENITKIKVESKKCTFIGYVIK